MARRSQRDSILDATERVIVGQGLARTTLEAIALEAGISKGGLLYHFPNKKELLLELIERHSQRMTAGREEMQATLPDGNAKVLRAHLMARLKEPPTRQISLSRIVDVLEDEDLRERVTAMRKREWQIIEKGVDNPERAAVLLLAMDGLWMLELFKVPVFSAEFRERIIAVMMDMVEES